MNQDVVLEQTQKLEALVELSEKLEASKNVKAAEKQLEKSRNADFPTIQFEALQRKQKAGNVDRESLAMGNSLEILAEELHVRRIDPTFIRKYWWY